MNQPWGTPPQQPAPGGYGQQPGGYGQQPPGYGQPAQQQWAGQGGGGQGQMVVDIKHHPLAFMFRFFTPVVAVNGQRVPARWGPNALTLPPGNHQLQIHIPYLLPSEIGRAAATVPVHPGGQVHLEYRAPMIVFMEGALGPAPQKWPGVAVMYGLLGFSALLLLLVILLSIVAAAAGA